MENQITAYFNCKQCLEELPAGQSPAEWARLNVGFTSEGIQVWCVRHDRNVGYFPLPSVPPVSCAHCDESANAPEPSGGE